MKHNDRYSFEAIVTHWDIEVFEQPDSTWRQRITDRIEAFDRAYSRFRADSLVTRIAKKAGTYELPDDAAPLLYLYQDLYEVTSGKMTPLIGQTMSEAGYDASYSLKSTSLHQPPKWEDVLRYEAPNLITSQPVLLDFGAAGKGYLVDIIGDLLKGLHCDKYCINAGGDILYHTTDNQRLQIGLEHPDDPSLAIGVVDLHNRALCGSAGNRRAWGEYHHIIDPFSLASPRHIAAAWTIADSTMLADSLATALFFVPAKELQKTYTFEYAIVYADQHLEHSRDFPGNFFTS